ncbi:MAG: hypothetical protein K2L37_05810, partial [Lactobacillus sp.]|nr:hypothetical protein [Lactobacillus sp.]
MKKGQILAALALAFALGVVAPVAGVYNSDVNAATRAVVSDPDAETATAAEVSAVINTIEAQPEYKAYVALNTANSDNTTYTSEATAQSEIAKALNTFDSSIEAGDTYAATLAAAQGIKNYSQWVKLLADMDTTDVTNGTVTAQAKVATLIQDAKNLGAVINEEDLDKDNWTTNLATVKSEIEGLTGYSEHKALIDVVNAQVEKVEASDASIDALKEALENVNVDSRDINTALADADPITALKALAKPLVTAGRGKLYVALATKIEGASIDKDASEANLTLINELKADYKAAAGSDLPGTSTPTDPEDPSTPSVNTIKSTDGKVTVTGNIPAGVYVEVVSEGVALPENFAGFGELKNAVYNIVLKNADGSIYKVNQTLVVSIAVPEGINGANSDVIYVTEMGGTENMKAKYADGFMTFTTNHFSIYAIVERAAGDNGDGNTE